MINTELKVNIQEGNVPKQSHSKVLSYGFLMISREIEVNFIHSFIEIKFIPY